MMKKLLIAFVCFFSLFVLFAQQDDGGQTAAEGQNAAVAENSESTAATEDQQSQQPNETSPIGGEVDYVAPDVAGTTLTEVSLDLFEREGGWYAVISSDDGIVTSRLFDGSATNKRPLPEKKEDKKEDSANANSENAENNGSGEEDTKVFGVRANFFRRGRDPIFIRPATPIPVDGVVKSISVLVAGRNFDHKLSVLVRDVLGHDFEIPMGSMNFSGWRQMTALIPASYDGKTGIIQTNVHYPNRSGLRILGFRIVCDPMDAFGSYYVYFDDLRAVTDMFVIESRDERDMRDDW